MSINVERWSLFNLWKCPRNRIDYRGVRNGSGTQDAAMRQCGSQSPWFAARQSWMQS